MLLLSIIVFSLQAVAQAPQTMTYQSVLRNSSNNLLVNIKVGTKISVLKGTASGTAAYTETQTTTTNANGLLSLQIGTGTVITGVFSDIDWANGPYFIKTETDPAGGSSYTITGTQQMASVPYALFAAKTGDAIAGPQGPIGLTGVAGSNGHDGATGAKGIQGLTGETGATGPEGIQGLIGLTGVDGSNGETGARGLDGQQGLTGETGPQGIQGDIGLTGATGVEGPQGLTGPEGIQGDIGLTGATGPEGLRGLTGATGTNGNNGAQGIQGIQGIMGLMGLTGPAGPAGTSLSGGSQLIQGLTGATGPQGPQGIQGDIGLTGPTGPEGRQGLTGATGSQGIQGDRGLTGATGPQGIQGLTGTTGAQGIQGLTGATGAVGSNGTNGAQGIQGLTGAGYNSITSTTSATPASTGTILLTTNQQGAFKTGDRIRVFNTASNYFEGMLTTTSGTTFSIVADYNVGTTAASSWTVSLTGVRGATGATGIQGLTGAAGSNGTNGAAGQQGIQGLTGLTGATGTQGIQGLTGATGPQGIKGETGLIAAGTVAGQMNYWNGTAWITVAPGTRTQTLTYCDGVPTWGPCLPGLTTTSATAITSYSATSGGSITIDNGEQVTARGVCWSTSTNPSIALSTKTSDGTGNGTFTSSITELKGATLYYFRAYATNSVGTSYGAQQSFTTLAASLPTLTTTAITQTGLIASSGGNIATDGGAAVSSRGICWSTTANPTIALSTKTTDGNGSGIFTSSTTGLNIGTLYYVRAYATNSAGTTYGNQQSFTSFSLPTLTTTAATNVSGATATSGGSITNDGGTAVTSRGVCWSTTANPTIALSTKTIDGTGAGVFTSSITGLNVSTLYHVRAYATNSVGTTYGTDLTFTTNTFVIGATYLGGKIAYIDATGIHGFIVSTSTENTSAEYGCMKYVQGATGTAIGTGAANTTKIVNACITSGIAARWCDGVNINGYTDWYLPSVNELMQVYSNRVAIGVVFNGVNYWSSTEKDGFSAYSMNFLDGTTNSSTSKSSLLYVRPVRSF